jgi:hypothetical protein
MTPQERDLLTAFLANLAAADTPVPDPEALSLIRNAVSARPDAAYLLVQQTLMQQAALGQAQARIHTLEQQAQDQQSRHVPAGNVSSFLGGGWSSPPPPPPGLAAAPGALPREPYGSPPAAAPSAPHGTSGVGSFLRSAATTAAGVAGGALLFQGIENLLGGHHGGGLFGGQAPIAGAPEIVENNTVVNEYQDGGSDPSGGLLGSSDQGWGAGPDESNPFDDADPFTGQSFDDDPSDWA